VGSEGNAASKRRAKRSAPGLEQLDDVVKKNETGKSRYSSASEQQWKQKPLRKSQRLDKAIGKKKKKPGTYQPKRGRTRPDEGRTLVITKKKSDLGMGQSAEPKYVPGMGGQKGTRTEQNSHKLGSRAKKGGQPHKRRARQSQKQSLWRGVNCIRSRVRKGGVRFAVRRHQKAE